MYFSREKSQHILALNKGITSLRMFWRRLPILSPPHLMAPHPKTLLADFSREFSEEFLSGTAGWCKRHDSSRGGWCGGWTCRCSPSDTLCSPALHHIWPISAFIHTLGSLNFYIFTLLLPFWSILTPYWPRILSTAPCCNIPTRAAAREVFFYSSNHSWGGFAWKCQHFPLSASPSVGHQENYPLPWHPCAEEPAKCQDGGLGPKWGSAEGSKPTFPSPFTERGFLSGGRLAEFSGTF